MSWLLRVGLLLLLTVFSTSVGAKEKLRLEIVEPYMEFRTGPGKHYPVFFVAQRGEQVEIQKRRNDWFKAVIVVQGGRKKVGWVHRQEIGIAHSANNSVASDTPQLAKNDPQLNYLFDPELYFGFSYGQTTGNDIVGVMLGYDVTKNIALELQVSEILGRNTESKTWAGVILLSPLSIGRFSPFAQIGGGGIDFETRGTNSQQGSGSEKFLQAGMGINVLLSERYRLRFEYRHLNIVLSDNENSEEETWHIGFNAYF